MSIDPKKKQALIKKYATTPKDTGSPEVQVAILTTRIQNLTEHMKTHKKDMGSRRGLLTLVGTRRTLLDYIRRINAKRYEALIDSLGLRR